MSSSASTSSTSGVDAHGADSSRDDSQFAESQAADPRASAASATDAQSAPSSRPESNPSIAGVAAERPKSRALESQACSSSRCGAGGTATHASGACCSCNACAAPRAHDAGSSACETWTWSLGDPARTLRDELARTTDPLVLGSARASGASSPLDRWRGRAPLREGGDTYLHAFAELRAFADASSIPTSTGLAGPSSAFFGSSDHAHERVDGALGIDAWKREAGAQSPAWRARVALAFAYDRIAVDELGVVSPDLGAGDERDETTFGIEEAWADYALARGDGSSARWNLRAGVFPFRSDFRGFIYDDSSLGVLASGGLASGWSWNLAAFDRRDRDTSTGLLELDESRDELVVVANVRRSDWLPFFGPRAGYATELSLHYANDERSEHVDEDGFPVAPPPIGAALSGSVETWYLGWAGEGRLTDSWSVSHALYRVLGEDEGNALAARGVDIDASLGALELSYVHDAWRYSLSALRASGDSDARDGKGEGFDAILDSPRFAGAGLSFWARNGLRLVGTKLKNEWSPLPDLSASQNEGHQNFVNPGLDLVGLSVAWDRDEPLRGAAGVSWLAFEDTDSLETLLQIDSIAREIGWELWAGAQWRPSREWNARIELGASLLFPGGGIERIYGDDDVPWGAFAALEVGF